MITNILLGAILGTIIGVFLILNNKINDLLKYCLKSFDILNANNKSNKYILEEVNDLINKYIKLTTVNKGYLNVFKDECQYLSNNVNRLKEKLNVIDTDIKFLIITEHKHTRNEIKKKAKISSKFDLKRKTNKSINK